MTKRHRASSAQFPDGAADVARRFGITVKALRLYERKGLIRPVRDEHGWRTFGQDECARIHLVLLLRRFGLTLARIGELFENRSPDLGAVLELQERALTDQRGRIDESLKLIARARSQLAAGKTINADTLAELARAEPLRFGWSRAIEELAAKIFTAAQQRHLADVASTVAAEWHVLYREMDELAGEAPDSPRAREIGGKAAALISRMTLGDDALRAALIRFWQDGLADPALAGSLPMDASRWHFLGAAMAAHAPKEAGK